MEQVLPTVIPLRDSARHRCAKTSERHWRFHDKGFGSHCPYRATALIPYGSHLAIRIWRNPRCSDSWLVAARQGLERQCLYSCSSRIGLPCGSGSLSATLKSSGCSGYRCWSLGRSFRFWTCSCICSPLWNLRPLVALAVAGKFRCPSMLLLPPLAVLATAAGLGLVA